MERFKDANEFFSSETPKQKNLPDAGKLEPLPTDRLPAWIAPGKQLHTAPWEEVLPLGLWESVRGLRDREDPSDPATRNGEVKIIKKNV